MATIDDFLERGRAPHGVPHGMDNSDDHIWFGRVIDGVLRTYWVLLSEVDAVDDYINKSPLGVQEAINSLYIGNDMLSLKKLKENSSTTSSIQGHVPCEWDGKVSAKSYKGIRAELRRCQETIQLLKSQRWESIPPEETIEQIVVGQPYSLEHYKSLSDKRALLELALACHDGNAIMAIVLFMKRTLNSTLFEKFLRRYPEALSHFTRYLEASGEWKTLWDLYRQLNRNEDALILQYRFISKMKDPKTKLREIEKLLSEYRNVQGVSEITTRIDEERSLLAKQIEIEEEDEKAEKQGRNAVLRYYPRTASIPLRPLLTTLYYCAMYHFDKPDNPFHPSAIKKEFKLSGKQYEWSVLPARAKLHRWIDISEILTASGWLKRKAEKSEIGFENVTEILLKNGAPKDVLQRNIALIENPESRLKAATKCSCHEAAIDTILAMRDRQKLEEYRENVRFDGQMRQKIQNLLADNNIRWK